MNKKKFGIICGIIALAILVIYLIFNSSWITHPKYMIDKQYCEVDSDCVTQKGCPINRYNQDKGTITFELLCLTCGVNCVNNKCIAVECNER
ncbi:hypothetical protein H6501_02875 [Candidatus Woesearchaeota archaeon]|nr:hypothetical protein [Candidatus Woesearchaeota archaeon]USN43592.1 MAG: hypothetical protein H6500_04320 [Candidatus Woesearchaeota archaeon]